MWPIIHMELWDKGDKRINGTWDWEEEERKGDIPVFYLRHLLHKPEGGGWSTPATHEPLMVVARRDRFTPILNQKFVTGEPLSEVVLKWFRINWYAQEEHFYTHTLENVVVVRIDLDVDMDFYHFKYQTINCRHELAAVEFEDSNQLVEKKLRASKGEQLKSWRDYEAEQNRKAARKASRKKANDQIRSKNNQPSPKPKENPGLSNNENSKIVESAVTGKSPKTKSPLKEGDVMSYKEYLGNREKGSPLRGHHIPQQQRLKDAGINPKEGTVVVIDKDKHSKTRTYGRRGAITKTKEAEQPLNNSELLDIRDPVIKDLGNDVADKIRNLNRANFPEKYFGEMQ